MKISLLKHNEIDKNKWDEIISKSTAPKIYGLSWYLDITAPNWSAIMDEKSDFIMPLPQKKKLGVIQYAPTPRFTQQLGVFSSKKISPELVNQFLEVIPKSFARKEILLNHSNPKIEDAIERDNFILELTDYEALRSNYATQIKRNIKQSEKFNLITKKEIDYKIIIELFEQTKAKDIEAIDYSILNDLCREAKKQQTLQTFGVFEKDQLQSGAILFAHLNRIYLIMLANNEKSRTNGASSALIDFVIKTNADKNIVLDFEGSNIPSLARFYKGFGSFNEPYQLYSKRLF